MGLMGIMQKDHEVKEKMFSTKCDRDPENREDGERSHAEEITDDRTQGAMPPAPLRPEFSYLADRSPFYHAILIESRM
jgi:hypothetical protein